MLRCGRDEWPQVERGTQLISDLIDCFRKPSKPTTKPRKRTKPTKTDKEKAFDKLSADADEYLNGLFHLTWSLWPKWYREIVDEPPKGDLSKENRFNEYMETIGARINTVDEGIAPLREPYNPWIETKKKLIKPVRLSGYKHGDFPNPHRKRVKRHSGLYQGSDEEKPEE
jgi:hypothetical protein